jgi:hypothetical protein
MRAWSIKTRLFIYSRLFCFVGLLLLGGYSYFIARRALLNRTFNQLTSIREEKAERVEQFFSDRVRDAELLSNQDVTANLAGKLADADFIDFSILERDKSLPNMLSFLQAAGCYNSLIIGKPNANALCIKLTDESLINHIVYINLKGNATKLKRYEGLHKVYTPVCQAERILKLIRWLIIK